MGNATFFYDELRFDTRDPDVTHVYVFLRGEGDCPHFVHGWHHKAFPCSVTTLEIQTQLWNGETNPLTWEREVPGAQPLVNLFNGQEFVTVRAQELLDWRASLLAPDLTNPVEIATEVADAITARLAVVPDWHKACPYCRAHDMMLQAQRNPQQ